MGNDDIFLSISKTTIISIHVPAWGTTPVGTMLIPYVEFQSTFPRGERQFGQRMFGLYCNFNPRSRVGNDAGRNDADPVCGISIHVPAWGTTLSSMLQTMIIIFQSTFPRGERLTACDDVLIPVISIHVPAWGTTEGKMVKKLYEVNFNPRSRVGNDVFPVPRPPHT